MMRSCLGPTGFFDTVQPPYRLPFPLDPNHIESVPNWPLKIHLMNFAAYIPSPGARNRPLNAKMRPYAARNGSIESQLLLRWDQKEPRRDIFLWSSPRWCVRSWGRPAVGQVSAHRPSLRCLKKNFRGFLIQDYSLSSQSLAPSLPFYCFCTGRNTVQIVIARDNSIRTWIQSAFIFNFGTVNIACNTTKPCAAPPRNDSYALHSVGACKYSGIATARQQSLY